MIFKLDVWYRYKGDEKDFEILEIEADTLALAKKKVHQLIRFVYRIDEIK